jgi:hypothetical protein
MRTHDGERGSGGRADEGQRGEQVSQDIAVDRSRQGAPMQRLSHGPGQRQQRDAGKPQKNVRARLFMPVHDLPRPCSVTLELIGGA